MSTSSTAPGSDARPLGTTGSAGTTGNPTTTGPVPRDLVVNGFVLAFAATVWLGWSQSDPPAGWTLTLIVLEVVFLATFVLGLVTFLRHRRGAGSRVTTEAGMRTYRRTVTVEAVAIVVGILVLALAHQAEYMAPWTLFVVGVHFLPLASLMRLRSLGVTGVVAAVVAVAAVGVGIGTDVQASFVAGGLGGLVIGLGGGWSLAAGVRTARRLGWAATPAA